MIILAYVPYVVAVVMPSSFWLKVYASVITMLAIAGVADYANSDPNANVPLPPEFGFFLFSIAIAGGVLGIVVRIAMLYVEARRGRRVPTIAAAVLGMATIAGALFY